jgi:DNA-binding response OmpR family regulator
MKDGVFRPANGGVTGPLSPTEAKLWEYLTSNAGRLVTRDELLENVWRLPAATVLTRTVDMHVSKLRAKVEADRTKPKRLVTVHGAGYMLQPISE